MSQTPTSRTFFTLWTEQQHQLSPRMEPSDVDSLMQIVQRVPSKALRDVIVTYIQAVQVVDSIRDCTKEGHNLRNTIVEGPSETVLMGDASPQNLISRGSPQPRGSELAMQDLSRVKQEIQQLSLVDEKLKKCSEVRNQLGALRGRSVEVVQSCEAKVHLVEESTIRLINEMEDVHHSAEVEVLAEVDAATKHIDETERRLMSSLRSATLKNAKIMADMRRRMKLIAERCLAEHDELSRRIRQLDNYDPKVESLERRGFEVKEEARQMIAFLEGASLEARQLANRAIAMSEDDSLEMPLLDTTILAVEHESRGDEALLRKLQLLANNGVESQHSTRRRDDVPIDRRSKSNKRGRTIDTAEDADDNEGHGRNIRKSSQKESRCRSRSGLSSLLYAAWEWVAPVDPESQSDGGSEDDSVQDRDEMLPIMASPVPQRVVAATATPPQPSVPRNSLSQKAFSPPPPFVSPTSTRRSGCLQSPPVPPVGFGPAVQMPVKAEKNIVSNGLQPFPSNRHSVVQGMPKMRVINASQQLSQAAAQVGSNQNSMEFGGSTQ